MVHSNLKSPIFVTGEFLEICDRTADEGSKGIITAGSQQQQLQHCNQVRTNLIIILCE